MSPPDLHLLATRGLAEAVPILLDLIRSYHRQAAADRPGDPRLLETARANCRKAIFLLYRIARLDGSAPPARAVPRRPSPADEDPVERRPTDPFPRPPVERAAMPVGDASLHSQTQPDAPAEPPTGTRDIAPRPAGASPMGSAPTAAQPAGDALIPRRPRLAGARTLLIAAGSTRPTPRAQSNSPNRAGRESATRARPPPR